MGALLQRQKIHRELGIRLRPARIVLRECRTVTLQLRLEAVRVSVLGEKRVAAADEIPAKLR